MRRYLSIGIVTFFLTACGVGNQTPISTPRPTAAATISSTPLPTLRSKPLGLITSAPTPSQKSTPYVWATQRAETATSAKGTVQAGIPLTETAHASFSEAYILPTISSRQTAYPTAVGRLEMQSGLRYDAPFVVNWILDLDRGGRVWPFTITFYETRGRPVALTECSYRIETLSGETYVSMYSDIDDILIPANGTASYQGFIGTELRFYDSNLTLDFVFEDGTEEGFYLYLKLFLSSQPAGTVTPTASE
jgi:hypothetical protein